MELKIKCINTTTSSDGSQYGKFVIEPLEKGFGMTIGNALRRVLLSSLEGAAATSIRIDGITHEYTSIPGIVEDAIDIMLNLKGLTVKTEDKDPQHLKLEIDRPGPVLASDWLICTISEGGSISADITIETGKGYRTVDVLKENKGNIPIDLLPIDASFMPIKRVSYNVENTRVGDVIDYDKLTLEIWSNGSIDVSSALSQAANLLIEHFMQIASISGQPAVLPTQHVVEEVEEEAQAPSISIEDLELSVRAYNCLKRASINSLPELLKKSEHDLLSIKNFGKKSSDEVIEKLHQVGLELQPNPEGVELEEV